MANNKDANLYRLVGDDRGAIKVNGRWVGFRCFRHSQLVIRNLIGNIRRWQGPPTRTIIDAVHNPVNF